MVWGERYIEWMILWDFVLENSFDFLVCATRDRIRYTKYTIFNDSEQTNFVFNFKIFVMYSSPLYAF